jgi:hypothetical protein
MVEFAITFDEVMQAGYCYMQDGKTLKKNWRVHPENMLWARVVSTAVGVVDPRVRAGLYTPEEMEDVSEDDATPAQATAHEPTERPTPKAMKPEQLKQATETIQKAFPEIERTSVLPAADAMETTRQMSKPPSIDDPFAALPDDGKVDYTIVPFGKYQGKKWTDLPNATLMAILNDPKTLTPQHIKAVENAVTNHIPF